MEKLDLLGIIRKLEFDKDYTLFEDREGTRLYVNRPSSLPARFKNYDLNKNFQIWMSDGNRIFRPNHLRLLIDLNLRVRSRPDLRFELLRGFDSIFYGFDPKESLKAVERENFQHFLNHVLFIGHLAQALFVEQEYNYNKESRYDPPSLFLLGWIRQFIDSPKEIDNLTMSVANRQPPSSKYVDKENRKSKKYVKGLGPLWYLDQAGKNASVSEFFD
ncbi:MAG: hypothetical protein M1410_04040 [Candidatus Thermoplasmatota archaeon]|jgi:hypothetical protein|nr:hypothetical protein [Candidatus Thermoplasmatota archaeon]